MPRFTPEFLEELRSRLNLEEIVSQYVPLKQKGRRFWGCCPFHREKTPSFSVDAQAQMYYCFGCHKGGTAFNFVMEMERMEFGEAVTYLAEKAHMPVPKDTQQYQGRTDERPKEREKIYEINKAAAHYFHSMLWKPEGAQILKYLYGRGLNDSDIRHFGLGATGQGWDGLLRHLDGLGYDKELVVKAWLAGKKDGRYYDMFRNRAIFPIVDVRGHVLGFGGRAMGDAQPKYLNSSDTPVFNKGRELYALNYAKSERDVGHLVLVEGYMDTVSLRKHGVRGVVATLGTALTEDQAKLIKRYTPEVWISYDGDAAGQKAAMRALDIFENVDGITAHVIDYPKGQDPDDFIRAHGLEGFERLTKYDATEYRMMRARDGLDLNTNEGITQYAMRCCEILKRVKDPIIMENNLRVLVNQTGYDRETLLRQIGTVPVKTEQMPRRSAGSFPSSRAKDEPSDFAEYALLTMLAQGLIPRDMLHPNDFTDENLSKLAEWLCKGKNAAAYIDTIEEQSERESIVRAMNYTPLPSDRDSVMEFAENCLATIRQNRKGRQLLSLQQKVKTTTDPAERAELYRQIQTIMQTMDD